MTLFLHKLSAPGWTKEFATEEEARVELFKHICGICCKGDKAYNAEGELVYESDPVDENSSLGDLLSTACGCEYMVDDEP